MKKELLIWNVVLTLVAGYLLFLQFGSGKKKSAAGKTPAKDTSASKEFRIAYFEMDSVEANFNLVKDVKAEISNKETEYSNNIDRLDQTYRKKYNEYAQKGQMTEEETLVAQTVLKDLGERLKAERQDIDQKYQEFVMFKNLEIKKKIEEYLKEYNKNKKYSYIISYEQGLFYFKDTAYNITTDIIRGLNDFYKPAKK